GAANGPTRRIPMMTAKAFLTATIVRGDALNADSVAGSFAGIADQAVSNVQIATFINQKRDATVDGVTVAIDWGDGTPMDGATGQLAVEGKTVTVTGSHTYLLPSESDNPYIVTVKLKAKGGLSVSSQARANISPIDAADQPGTGVGVPSG